MAKAYLNLILQGGREGIFPPVVGIAVHSSEPAGLTNFNNYIYANLMEFEGKDYQEAHEKCIEWLKKARGWEWAYAWLNDTWMDTVEGRDARYQLQLKLETELAEKFPKL